MNGRPPAPMARPASPRPPVKQKKHRKNGSGIGKWIFILFLLMVAYLGIQTFFLSGNNKQSDTPSKTVVQKPDSPSNTWSQSYLTTFNYADQRVTTRSVTVRNLDRTTASLAYIVSINSSRGAKWIQNKKTWKIGRNNKTKNAERVSVRTVNAETVATVRFQFATEDLEKGSFMQIDIPQLSKKKSGKVLRTYPVKVGIEIPPSHRGIEERDGTGGL